MSDMLSEIGMNNESLAFKQHLSPFLQQYSPTSFDKSYAAHEVDRHDVEFTFWDTSGE